MIQTERPPRVAVRGLLLRDDRLLLVNAYPGDVSDLWCAPGGGVERHVSLSDNLIREMHEETGLDVEVGAPVLVNEFHAPDDDFHQVEIFFRVRAEGDLPPRWTDPEGVVKTRQFFGREDAAGLRVKPDSLLAAAWGDGVLAYDSLERLVK
ncbi:MAG: NUDIX hydrolase [Pseudomonadota bacterium]